MCCLSVFLFAFITDAVVSLIEAPKVDVVLLDISQNDTQENEDLNEDNEDDFVILSHSMTRVQRKSLNVSPLSLGFSLDLSQRKIPAPPPDFLT